MGDNLLINTIDFDRFAEKILSLLNANKPKDFLFADIVTLVQNETGIECIGLRLQDGFDYPYYVTRGFSQDFVKKENFLCPLDADGNPTKGPFGLPKLDCMCGNIIRGRTDSSLPHFTRGGSFWTNSTTDFIARASVLDLQESTRNRCNREGYESVALIPIRDQATYGLLQLNDRRKNLFTLNFIELMEWAAATIGVLLSYLYQHDNFVSLKEKLAHHQPFQVFGPIKSNK